ncbi:MAG: hypothetical protein ABJB47_10345 [Actinomycetota bacterium]
MAAGQVTDTLVRDVLADVLAVFGSETGLHWGTLAERLARGFPDRWADATAEVVSAECRAAASPRWT